MPRVLEAQNIRVTGLSVINNGPDDEPNAKVTLNNLPTGGAVSSVSLPAGATFAGNVVTLGAIASGASVAFTVDVTNPAGNIGLQADNLTFDVTGDNADANLTDNSDDVAIDSWERLQFSTVADGVTITPTATQAEAAVWHFGADAVEFANMQATNAPSGVYPAGAGSKTISLWHRDLTALDVSMCELTSIPALPDGITSFIANGNPIATINAAAFAATSLTEISLQNCYLSAGQIAQVIDQVHANRASYVGLTLRLQGTASAASANAVPSAADLIKLDEIRAAGHAVIVNEELTLTTNKSGSFTAQIITTANALWIFGDGNTSLGATAAHTYADGTTKVARVVVDDSALVTQIIADNAGLMALDFSAGFDVSALTRISLNSNQLTTLPAVLSTATATEWIYVQSNAALASLPPLNNLPLLERLFCNGCALTSLNGARPDSMELLYCYGNNLANIDEMDGCTTLKQLLCQQNPALTTMPDISGSPLTDVWCYGCALTALWDYSANAALVNLRAYSNVINTLPQSFAALSALKQLLIYDNQIPTLTGVESCTAMEDLQYHQNLISVAVNTDAMPALRLHRLQINNIAGVINVANNPLLEELYCYENTGITAVTGAAACTVMDRARLYSTAITDAPLFTNAPGIQEIQYESAALTQASIDALLADLYAKRASYNHTSAPMLILNGPGNAAPSGVFQAAAPPTTGNEFRFAMVNDAGILNWSIAAN